jgi:hypothetical protein
MHVLAYAEVLFRWKLLHKRIELLKAVDPFMRLPSDSYFNSDHSQLGTLRHLGRVYVRCPIPLLTYLSRGRRRGTGVSILCTQCSRPTASRTQSTCSACGTRLGMPRCSVCRLPVKGTSCHPTSCTLFLTKHVLIGLSFNCLGCRHVSHLSCWRSRRSATCSTGCPCRCRAMVQA